MSLNQEQQEAVEHKEGPLLVIAGAGSGKTRIVTQRIVHLIDSGVHPVRILGVTFTNKAADEMKKRVQSLTSKKVLISTFHSLGSRILRESYPHPFTIYDSEDSEKLLKSCLETLQLVDRKKSLKAFRSLISQSKNALLPPSEITSDDEKLFPDVYAIYQARLRECQAVDFDDLLYLPVRLFEEHPEILGKYQQRWQYILVDEYQDTNTAQYTLIRLLSQQSNNVFVVGDPDQSIYSWRGANIGNILNFERDFPGAKVIRLEQNYRSKNTILQAANALISSNQNRYHKELWSERGGGERVEVYSADDEEDEAQYIVDRIIERERDGISFNEMAIFYRTNFQSRVFEDYLLANRIPYTLVGSLSFYQRKEIKDMLAFLRMVITGSDFIAFTRTFSLKKRGIGAATLDKIRLGSIQEGIPIFDYCTALVQEEPLQNPIRLSKAQKNNLKSYVDIILDIRETAKKSSLSELVKAIIFIANYETLLQKDPDNYSDRRDNIYELVTKAAEWEKRAENPTLEDFLSELTLKSSLDQVDEGADCVRLMTLHHGKGLEFENVFLVGLEEDLLPHINSKKNPEQLEEERRLCYVGMTRAKERLYLSQANHRLLWGNWRSMYPSRFLREIPEHLYQSAKI